MGCDGGTIPKRDELVRKKKKAEKVTKEDSRNVKWKNCAMSQEVLEKPIVACELGKIFNKESVINFLIQKKSSPESVDPVFSTYIRNLKDIKELKLTSNPAYKDDADKAGQAQKEVQFICPITGLGMSGNYRFVFLWTCGCVFSERGLKEIKDGICSECNQSYTDDDIITINAETEEEVNGMKDRMKERRSKNGTKNKRKREQVEDASAPGPSKPQKQPIDANTASTSGQSKVSKPKKPKTIQDDPNASETYKSIFNTHPIAKNQVKAHWVSCNPFYY